MKKYAAHLIDMGEGRTVKNGYLVIGSDGVLEQVASLDDEGEVANTVYINGVIKVMHGVMETGCGQKIVALTEVKFIDAMTYEITDKTKVRVL